MANHNNNMYLLYRIDNPSDHHVIGPESCLSIGGKSFAITQLDLEGLIKGGNINLDRVHTNQPQLIQPNRNFSAGESYSNDEYDNGNNEYDNDEYDNGNDEFGNNKFNDDNEYDDNNDLSAGQGSGQGNGQGNGSNLDITVINRSSIPQYQNILPLKQSTNYQEVINTNSNNNQEVSVLDALVTQKLANMLRNYKSSNNNY